MTRSALQLAVLGFALAACSGGSGSGGAGGGEGGGQGGAGGGLSIDLDAGPFGYCKSVDPELTEASVLAAMTALESDGRVDVALSGDGCLRYERTRTGGLIQSARVYRYTGFVKFGFDFDAGGLTRTDEVKVRGTWARDGGVLYAIIDGDENGVPGSTVEDEHSATDRTRRVVSALSATGSVIRKTTLTFLGGGRVRHLSEAVPPSGGALVPVQDAEVDTQQHQVGCIGTGPKAYLSDSACATYQTRLKSLLAQAIAQASACLKGAGGTGLATQLATHLGQLQFKCYTGGGTEGETNIQALPPVIEFNVDAFTCASPPPPNQQAGTVFHEYLHQLLGAHDPVREHGNFTDSAEDLDRFTYADQIMSCERMCFGSLQNRCTCARCLNTTTCDSRCSGMGSCTKRFPDGGAYQSDAIGAACDPRPSGMGAYPNDATGMPVTAPWFRNMAACRSSCATTCKSYSLSCNATCN